ncbi:MAG: hypothetical protein ABFR36_07320 [Acidobacteriota bacterium]
MNNGFSIMEILIVITISFAIFGIVMSNITEGIAVSRKITTRQQVLESLFFTVDTIKNDLTKCGMRLQEAAELFDIPLFSNTQSGFKVIYGLASDELMENCYKGDNRIEVTGNDFVKKGRKILVYDAVSKRHEFIRIKKVDGNSLLLDSPMRSDHLKHSVIIPLKEIEMKLYKKERTIKRKVDRGYFQPVIEGVTDFYISFFDDSNSVLYRLEIDGKEQVRGYIFLSNRGG